MLTLLTKSRLRPLFLACLTAASWPTNSWANPQFNPSNDTQQLLAHWPLDEQNGHRAADVSGYGQAGILNNNPGWTTTGVLFDGDDDYIDVGALDIHGNAMTLSAWFKADQLNNCAAHDCRILSKASGTPEQAHYWMISTIRVGNTTRLRFRLKTNGVTTTLIGQGIVTEGEWVHVTAVYDGAEMRLYQDGLEVGSRPKTGLIETHPGVPAWIGGNPLTANSRPWQGEIGDVRVYNHALTEDGIQALMSNNGSELSNALPTARADSVSTEENQAVTVDVLANDDSADGIEWVDIDHPARHGFAVVNSDSSITYIPGTDFSGLDHFTYRITDADGDTATTTVTVTVQANTRTPESGSGLLAHWPLDEQGGEWAEDISGAGQTGVLINDPDWTATGVLFDGQDDYIDVGPLDIHGNAMTLSAWFKADQLNNCAAHDCRILSKASGTPEQAHYWMISTIRVGNTTRLRFRLKTNGVTTTLVAHRGIVQEGDWIHIAAVYDGTEMRLYQNGTEVGSQAKTGLIETDPAVPVWIGGNPLAANSRPWEGQIRDVKIYDEALTDQAIQANVSSTKLQAEHTGGDYALFFEHYLASTFFLARLEDLSADTPPLIEPVQVSLQDFSAQLGNYDVSIDGQTVVFAGLVQNDWNLYRGTIDVSRATITHITPLADQRGVREEDPRISWDGTQVVYKCDGDICIADIDRPRSGTRLISDWCELYAPTINTDGTVIAYTRRCGDEEQDRVVLYDTLNGQELELHSQGGGSDRFPHFLADGRLVYSHMDVLSGTVSLWEYNPENHQNPLSAFHDRAVSDDDPFTHKQETDYLFFIGYNEQDKHYDLYVYREETGDSVRLSDHQPMLGTIVFRSVHP